MLLEEFRRSVVSAKLGVTKNTDSCSHGSDLVFFPNIQLCRSVREIRSPKGHLMKEMCTPMFRCVAEHSRQMYTP